ncbi:MAG: hypothetical protein QXH91_03350 [Candidatus Bathyarchaeia archaeon]
MEILKIKNPDGICDYKAIISLRDAIGYANQSQKLIIIQKEYSKFLENCKEMIEKIENDHKSRSNPHLQWMLSDRIYSFMKWVENCGFIFTNIFETLSKEVGISKTQLRYLIRFRESYPSIDQVSREINWSKYRELLDISDKNKRLLCENLIKIGKIKSDKEIRKFKRFTSTIKNTINQS